MDIYILRHAIAEPNTDENRSQDSLRRLTPEGAEKMQRIAEGMKALGLSFDLILSSPYLRAKETAEIVAKVFKLRKELRFSAALTPQMNPGKIIEELNARHGGCRSILLVGHEPHLSGLISRLLSGDDRMTIDLKKGGLAKLTAETLHSGRCAGLEWLLNPRQLRMF